MENSLGSERQEILSGLYTLRAGLSVIATEKTNADKALENGKAEKQKILSDGKAKVKEAKDGVANAEKTLAKRVADEKSNRSTANADIRSYKKRNAGNTKWWVLFFLTLIPVLVFAAAIVLVLMYGCVSIFADDKDIRTWEWFSNLYGWMGSWSGAFVWIGIAELVVFAAAGGAFIFLAFKIKNKIFYFDIDQAEKSKESAIKATASKRKAVENAGKKVEAAQAALAIAESEYEQTKKQANSALTVAKGKAADHVGAGLMLYQGLNDAFGKLLDIRDWSNLDYIIYAMETGRADSVKEALQLVDRERQTERIVQAVAQASNEICRNINMSVNRLQENMVKCFVVLSEQMTNQTKAIITQVGSLKGRIAEQSAYIANLTSATSMNNALLAKANVTSAELARDVEQLRVNSDYAEIRRRNGM